LALCHPVKVSVQADVLVLRLCGFETEQFGQFGPVGIVLIATHLEVLIEFFVELCVSGFLVLVLFVFLLL